MNKLLWIALCGLAGTVGALEAPETSSVDQVQVITQAGEIDAALDFDLDAAGHGHVAYLELSANISDDSRGALLKHRYFDGTIWREQVLNIITLPRTGVGVDGQGLMAVTLSTSAGPLEHFNVLYLDRAGPGTADDSLRLIRTGIGTPEMVVLTSGGAVHGLQLVAAPDDVLYAAWLESDTQRIRLAVGQAGNFSRLEYVSPAGANPSPPALAVSPQGRVVLAYESAGSIRLWEDVAGAMLEIGAPQTDGVTGPVALGFADTDPLVDSLSVAFVRQADGQDLLHVLQSNAGVFPALTAPVYSSTEGSLRLLERNALAVQAQSAGSQGEVLFYENGAVRMLDMASHQVFDEVRVGGSLRGLRRWPPHFRSGLAFDRLDGSDLQWHENRAWVIHSQPDQLGPTVMSHAVHTDGSPVLLFAADQRLELGTWDPQGHRFEYESVPRGPSGSDTPARALLTINGGQLALAYTMQNSADIRLLQRVDGGPWQYRTITAGVDPISLTGLDIDDSGQVFLLGVEALGGLPSALRLTVVNGDQISGTQEVGNYAFGSAKLAVARVSGDAYISAYDASTQSLRVLHRRPSGVQETHWDLQLDQHRVGEHHALTVTAEGQPVLAYSLRANAGGIDRLFYRFHRSGIVVEEEIFPQGQAGVLRHLEISLKNGSAELARVLRYQEGGQITGSNLYFDQRRVGFSPSVAPWRTQRFTDFIAVPGDLAAQIDATAEDRVFVLESRAGSSTLSMARKLSQADDAGEEIVVPLPPIQRFGSSLLCRCPGAELPGQAPLQSCRAELTRQTQGNAALFAELRQRFTTTPAGRYYLELWAVHGDEIASLALRDPTAMALRIRAFSDFAPGLQAFVNGAGFQHQLTPRMLSQARAVFEQWSSSGSSDLRAIANQELARLDGFRDFEGMTFDQWFAALSVPGSSATLFGNGFE